MDKEENITKEKPVTEIKIIKTIHLIKPVCLTIAIVGVGFYLFKNNQVKEVKPKECINQKINQKK